MGHKDHKDHTGHKENKTVDNRQVDKQEVDRQAKELLQAHKEGHNKAHKVVGTA